MHLFQYRAIFFADVVGLKVIGMKNKISDPNSNSNPEKLYPPHIKASGDYGVIVKVIGNRSGGWSSNHG